MIILINTGVQQIKLPDENFFFILFLLLVAIKRSQLSPRNLHSVNSEVMYLKCFCHKRDIQNSSHAVPCEIHLSEDMVHLQWLMWHVIYSSYVFGFTYIRITRFCFIFHLSYMLFWQSFVSDSYHKNIKKLKSSIQIKDFKRNIEQRFCRMKLDMWDMWV